MYQKFKSYIPLIISSFFLSSNLSFAIPNPKACIKKFLVFDVGSATTKGMLYTKDVCNNTTIAKHSVNKNYPYQTCLSESKSNHLPKQCIKDGVGVIQSIKEHFGIQCINDAQCHALATGWARNTNNIDDWLKAIEKVGVQPIIASQDYEGELKLHTIKHKVVKPNERFLAFDIGGGSFQLAWFDKYNTKNHYNSLYGTDSFTYKMQEKFLSASDLSCIKARNNFMMQTKSSGNDQILLSDATDQIKQSCTTNSLSSIQHLDLDKMIEYADEIIGQPIKNNKELQSFVKKYTPEVYADSLLFSLGIKEQLGCNKNIITIDDIYHLMNSVSGITHNQIKNKYPKLPDICINTTQGAMLLIYTIMKSLNIHQIHIVQTDYMSHFIDSQLKQ